MKKRLIAFLLVLIMVLGMLPVSAFAADTLTLSISYNANAGSDTVTNMPPYEAASTGVAEAIWFVSDYVPVRDGYTFLYWSDAPEADQGTRYNAGTKITLNEENPTLTLYAIWEKNSSSLVAYYYKNYGTETEDDYIDKYEAKKPGSYYISLKFPTRDGYDFLGWSEDKTATKPQYARSKLNGTSDAIYIDREIKLYAVWQLTGTGPQPPIKPADFTDDLDKFEFTLVCESNSSHNRTVTFGDLAKVSYYTKSWGYADTAKLEVWATNAVKLYDGHVVKDAKQLMVAELQWVNDETNADGSYKPGKWVLKEGQTLTINLEDESSGKPEKPSKPDVTTLEPIHFTCRDYAEHNGDLLINRSGGYSMGDVTYDEAKGQWYVNVYPLTNWLASRYDYWTKSNWAGWTDTDEHQVVNLDSNLSARYYYNNEDGTWATSKPMNVVVSCEETPEPTVSTLGLSGTKVKIKCDYGDMTHSMDLPVELVLPTIDWTPGEETCTVTFSADKWIAKYKERITDKYGAEYGCHEAVKGQSDVVKTYTLVDNAWTTTDTSVPEFHVQCVNERIRVCVKVIDGAGNDVTASFKGTDFGTKLMDGRYDVGTVRTLMQVESMTEDELENSELATLIENKLSSGNWQPRTGVETEFWRAEHMAFTGISARDDDGIFTLYAQIIAYKLTLDTDGGTLTEESPEGYYLSSSKVYLPTAEKRGYEFVRWEEVDESGDGDDGGVIIMSLMEDAIETGAWDVTYKAIYEQLPFPTEKPDVTAYGVGIRCLDKNTDGSDVHGLYEYYGIPTVPAKTNPQYTETNAELAADEETGEYYYSITIDPERYVAMYNKGFGGDHTEVAGSSDLTITWKWENGWVCQNEKPEGATLDGTMVIINVKSREVAPVVDALVAVHDETGKHGDIEYGAPLLPNSHYENSKGSYEQNADGDYIYTATIVPQKFIDQYNKTLGEPEHKFASASGTTLQWRWGEDGWEMINEDVEGQKDNVKIVINVNCEQPIYAYFKPVNTDGETITLAAGADKTLDRLNLTYNSTKSWFTYGKMMSAASTLDGVLSDLANGNTIERYSGNADFAYGDQIVWKSLAMKQAGWHDVYNTETPGEAYHLDGDLTLYRTAFDKNTDDEVTGMPEELYPDALVYDYFASGEQIVMPADPTRTGYKFLGWEAQEVNPKPDKYSDPATDADADANALLKSGDTYPITDKDVVFVAQWFALPDGKPSYSGLKIRVDCVDNESGHKQGAYNYGLVIGLDDYSGINEPESWVEENGEYFYTVTINKDVYIGKYVSYTKAAHTEVGENKTEVKWQWDGTKWVLQNEKDKKGVVLTINVKCEPKQTVNVVIYRNGNTETAYKTFSLDAQPKGTVIDLTKLNIADYYSANYTGKYETYGWYNDGTWNVYKANPANAPAGLDSITVNGWTNIIAMVYDYEKITVSTTLKDGSIYSDTVLRGTNVVDYLNGLGLDLDVPGYDIDADKDGNINWYKKDSPKWTFGANDTVQGWTNVLVKYSVTPHNIYAFARLNSTFAPLTSAEFGEFVKLNAATLERLGLGSYNANNYISIGSFLFDELPLTEDMYFGDDAELAAVLTALETKLVLETGVDAATAEKIAWTFLFQVDNSDYMTEAGYPTDDEKSYQLSGNLNLATVMFRAGGDNVEGMPAVNYTYDDILEIHDFYFSGDTFTLPAEEPTREGYVFKGWSAEVIPGESDVDVYANDPETDEGATLYKAGDTYAITDGGVIFTAQWELNTYIIASDLRLNGNETVKETGKTYSWTHRYGGDYGKTIDYTEMLAALENKALEVDAANEPYSVDVELRFPGDSKKEKKLFNDVILTYGQQGGGWNPGVKNTAYIWGYATTSYEVIFNADGGSAVDTQIVKYGEKAVEPTTTREGYDFLGWFDKDGNLFDFNTEITHKTELTAQWEKKSYIIASDLRLNGNETVKETGKTYSWTHRYGGKFEETIDYTEMLDALENKALEVDAANEPYSVDVELRFPGDSKKERKLFNDVILTYGQQGGGWNPGVKNTAYIWGYATTSYEVIFNADGGSAVDTQIVKYGEKAVEPTTTRAGYTFLGWFDKDGKAFDFDTEITCKTELTAKWEITPHNIYAYLRTGDSIGDVLELNETTLNRLGLTKYNTAGFISIGTFVSNTLLTQDEYYGFDEEEAFLAVLEELKTKLVPETGVSLDKVGSKINWSWLYQLSDVDERIAGYPTEDKDGYQLSGSLLLYGAKFAAGADNVTGMPTTAYSAYYDYYVDGESFTLPAAPTRPGYTFKGWKIGNTTLEAGASYTVDGEDMVFTAQWEITPHNIYAGARLNSYFAPLTPGEVGDEYVRLNADTLTRLGLGAYNANSYISIGSFTFDAMPLTEGLYMSDDAELLAVVEALKTKLTREANVDAKTAEKIAWTVLYEAAVYGDDLGVVYPTDDKTGYQLSGNLNLASVTFRAGAENVENMPAVNYTYDDGAIDFYDFYFDGDSITMPADPTRAKYTFMGWKAQVLPAAGDLDAYANGADDEGETLYKAGDTYTVTDGGVIFTAQWELTATPIGDTYVRYDVLHIKQLPDGTYDLANAEVEHLSALKDSTVTAVVRDYRATHHFFNSTLGTLTGTAIQPYMGTDGKPVYTILSVYYDLDEHTLTFDTMGGSRVAPVTVRHGLTVAKPADPEYGGFIFDGWYTDKTFRTLYNFAAPLTADTTVYAKWIPITLPGVTVKKTAPKLNTADHFAYVQGYPNGTVKPAGNITRAETAAILFRLMDDASRNTYYSTRSSFRDVASGSWYNTYVATLDNAGVITDSSNGYFRPNEAITRAELAAMLAKFSETTGAANYFNDVSASHWAANAIAICAKLGWITGYPDGSFRPDKNVTRAELMAMINRATGRAPKSADAFLPGMKTWSDNTADKWYYLDVQEATNSHSYTVKGSETWTALTSDPNWSKYE